MQSKYSSRLALNAVTYSKFDANARIGQVVFSRFRAFGARPVRQRDHVLGAENSRLT